MRAAFYDKNGPARDVLSVGDIPSPTAAPGEVLVRVAASGINPIDLKWRSGLRPLAEGDRMVPHFDGAGEIVAVGEGVSPKRVGERVWIFEALWQRRQGTAAELCAVPAEHAAPLPRHVGFAEGACLGIPALTAHRCVFADGPVDGQRILVTGGAGAVGSAAIRLARLAGAQVITTVSSNEKAEAARQAGAEVVVNYRTQDVVEAVSKLGKVDRIIDVALGVNFPQSVELIADNGTIVSYASDAMPEPILPFRKLLYKNATVRHVLVFGMPDEAKRHAVADIGNWLQADSFRPSVGATFPLADIAAAHERAESGAIGQVVVEVAA